ncbi:MAG TPA: tRNA preQ1(34) S-adenosylmethionine ribosyltransferase-isomerase QueA [Haliangiales bacterium]|nr:tRNA preQ1(34) S-adenosylmethionine ribosyltransferase-isomerase QueA [Haliangiales bacterium]
MRTSDFDYDLPPELIAQAPSPRREDARLLVVGRGAVEHRGVAELPDLLPAGALVVVNDVRVLPARLHARKPTGGAVEILLVHPEADGTWRCLVRAKSLAPGTQLTLVAPPGRRPPPAEIAFLGRDGEQARVGPVAPACIEAYGSVPLPPYIERPPTAADEERYQTVYARHPGAVAAPTAGLHFTPAMLAALAARGIDVAAVTLHVGLGTFAPVRTENPDEHVMHAETFVVPPETAAAHAAARAAGRPIVAVGTTVVRTLESARDGQGALRAGAGETRLFIRPGYRFSMLDLLLTNFHLPRSTLLMLVAAFGGRERVLAAYREAVRRRYRFFSYGDGMLLWP